MAQETRRKEQIQRIATLIGQLESCADPNLRALALELLESIMALHGAGLERILELAAKCGQAGEHLVQQCGHDELVSSLLLLYGLHPEDLRTRVERALEKSKRFLDPHAAHAELVAIDSEGAVRVRLCHKPHGSCGSGSLRSTLESVLQDAAPDATAFVVEETGVPQAGFVPVGQLQTGQPLSAWSRANSARGGG